MAACSFVFSPTYRHEYILHGSTGSEFCIASRPWKRATAPKRPRVQTGRRRILSSTASEQTDGALADVFSVGDIVANRYKIRSILGRGSNGVTYEASMQTGDWNKAEIVALKVLSLRGMGSWKPLELFQREGRILQSLDHPAIPAYVDSFEVPSARDVAYVLVQRKAQGRSLQSIIDGGYRFSQPQIYSVCRQLLELLAYLGGLFPPVVHRDIKPGNVVVDLDAVDEAGERYPRVSLVDFGSGAAAVRPAAGPGSTMVGTFGYMAPEQLGGITDARTDLYGVGATLLAALTGSSPAEFPRSRLRIDVDALFSESEQARLGPVFVVLKRLIEPAPEDRFPDATAALAALSGAISISEASDVAVARAAMLLGEPDAPLALAPGDATTLRTEVLRVLSHGHPQSRTRQRRNAGGGLLSWLRRGRAELRRPAGTRVVIDRDDDYRLLCITIPPPGFSAETVYSGAFALAWNALLASWTVGALVTGGGAILAGLFSAPFWVMGVRLARIPLADLRGTTALVVSNGVSEDEDEKSKGVYYFRLAGAGDWGGMRVVEGDARDLDGVKIEKKVYEQGHFESRLVLLEGTKTHRLCDALVPVEEKWLRSEINDFLGFS